MKLSLYWQAWKLLPRLARIGFIFAEAVSWFIYWASSRAIAGDTGCFAGGCSQVTDQAILQTEISGIALGVMFVGILVFSLYLLGKTMEKENLTFDEAKGKIEKAMES